MKKEYLIDRLISENWFASEKEALPWIISGKVLADNQRILSGKEKVNIDAVIRVKEYYKKKYVNKGGLKLEGALRDFGLDISGMAALDCGASAGGFTDCLLQSGAKLVYAVDAGHGQLAGKLLIDGRVINMERTNLSDGRLLVLEPKPDIVTLDLSKLSLKKAVLISRDILKASGIIVALIKPVYESPEASHEDIIIDLCGYFIGHGFSIMGMAGSRVRGNNDALEYFIYLDCGANPDNINDARGYYIKKITEGADALERFRKNEFVNLK
jgi:23S rRNA (cytidine1920-2'-O)/16S rRNA (cytidine1409-2'-O)-methyltransferase